MKTIEKITCILLTMIVILPWATFAQRGRIVTIEGTSQVPYPNNKSKDQVDAEAENKAIINAMEMEFGTAVIEGNSLYLQNLNMGKTVKTISNFTSFGNTIVGGEVLEIVKKNCEEVTGKMLIGGREEKVKEYKCTVRIRARELSELKPEFEAFPMACLNVKCQTTSFNYRDTLYLYFKSPSSGFLSVFIDDGKLCQRLLPYRRLTEYENGAPIIADMGYYLFSKNKNYTYFGDAELTDTYLMSADNPQDQSRIYVVFSTTLIQKPGLKEGLGIEKLSQEDKEKGAKVPKALSSEEFLRWQIKNRTINKNISISTIDVTTTK